MTEGSISSMSQHQINEGGLSSWDLSQTLADLSTSEAPCPPSVDTPPSSYLISRTALRIIAEAKRFIGLISSSGSVLGSGVRVFFGFR